MSITVRIDLPGADATDGQATVWKLSAADGVKEHPVLLMRVNPAVVAKRFRKGETRGYFSATIEPGGVLEVGDRLPDGGW